MDKASISSMSLIFGATQRQTLTKTIGCLWRSPVSQHKGGSTQYTGWIHDACVDCAFPNTKINSKGYSRVNLHWGWVCSLPILSAVSHELGIPLAQCAVSEKTNEVPISRQLLKAFDVRQKVVTTDALLTQRHFCEEIIAHQADYLLPVKANQKQMYQDIQDLFAPFSETDTPEVETRRFESLHTQAEAHLDTHTSVEKAHGFLTTRTLTASTLLTDDTNWPGLDQVYQYRIERKHLRTGEITHQTQYGITSLAPQDASAEDLLTLRRGHWTIENKVHWIRDVVFAEDASQVRTGGIPQVMAALRNTVLSVLRFKGYTKISETLRFFAARPKLAVKLIK